MATEIERKFLVIGDGWREAADAGERYEQGYLCGDGPASVRVRVAAGHAHLNIKAAVIGTARAEYEYPVPLADARSMLESLCVGAAVIKTRYRVPYAGHLWEVDVFEADNAPLVVAEIELEAVDEAFERPAWVGAEISDDRRYYNHALAFEPYARWRA